VFLGVAWLLLFSGINIYLLLLFLSDVFFSIMCVSLPVACCFLPSQVACYPCAGHGGENGERCQHESDSNALKKLPLLSDRTLAPQHFKTVVAHARHQACTTGNDVPNGMA
jgi:hypothetical protein